MCVFKRGCLSWFKRQNITYGTPTQPSLIHSYIFFFAKTPLPVTLYTVSTVIILDSAGKRIYAKYYDHAEEFVNSTRKQESFEKSIHEKTRKQNSKIELLCKL